MNARQAGNAVSYYAERTARELQQARSERKRLERLRQDCLGLRKQALMDKALAKTDKAKREAQARIRREDADLKALSERIAGYDEILECEDALRQRAAAQDGLDDERALKLARLGARYEQRAKDIDQLLERLADGVEALLGVAAEIRAHAIEGAGDEWKPAYPLALTSKLELLLKRALGGMLPGLQVEPRLNSRGEVVADQALAQFAAGWRQYLGHVPEPVNPKAPGGTP